MLLEKEWFKMQKEELPWGIQAKPLNEDDMFTWEGTIKGPKDTMWEGWCDVFLKACSKRTK